MNPLASEPYSPPRAGEAEGQASPPAFPEVAGNRMAGYNVGESRPQLHKALDVCGRCEKKVDMAGRDSGATSAEFGQYLMDTVEDSTLESRWDTYVHALFAPDIPLSDYH